MKIGIDISQLAYPHSGVSNYLQNLVTELIVRDQKNEYVLFFSSLRGKIPETDWVRKNNVVIKKSKIPPSILNIMWNRLHLFPIEWFIGNVDYFITSDWTEPPALKAKKATILYDLIVYRHPEETASSIVRTQKQKLKWVKKESDLIFCISKSTARDAEELLGINKKRLKVLYPGI